jgi:hypothetical protein
MRAAGARLLKGTRPFLGTGQWLQCLRLGWTLADVFGVDAWSPLDRRDVLGLVPGAAFSPKSGRVLEALTNAGAVFRDPDGREIQFRRPSLHAVDAGDVVPWWRSEALINLESAA